jgi:hypothetical protein
LPKKRITTSSGGEDDETLERHYRVTLDFRLLLRPFTEEACRESYFLNERSASDGEPSFRESVERQRRLYHLLRNDPETLERYLLSVLTQEAGICVYEGLPDAFDVADEYELLVPLYSGMAKEDAEFFKECRGMGALAENIELIERAFEVEWLGAEVAEISRKVEGDVRRAEAVVQTKRRLARRLVAHEYSRKGR